MTVKNLSETSFEELFSCFLKSFENYFVPLSTDANYYRQRWKAAKVDFSLSYGMFHNGKLVGFIIHAVDTRHGQKTAYNTGTGVLPEYRGQKIVNRIYAHAIPRLKKSGVTRCTLEVIKQNKIAIRAYQGIGFGICRNYACLKGTIDLPEKEVSVREIAYEDLDWESLPGQDLYSWDHHKNTLKEGNYRYYQLMKGSAPSGYFVINDSNGYLAQFESFEQDIPGWTRLFTAIKSISPAVKIINVDERQTEKLKFLRSLGLEDLAGGQFEMELKL